MWPISITLVVSTTPAVRSGMASPLKRVRTACASANSRMPRALSVSLDSTNASDHCRNRCRRLRRTPGIASCTRASTRNCSSWPKISRSIGSCGATLSCRRRSECASRSAMPSAAPRNDAKSSSSREGCRCGAKAGSGRPARYSRWPRKWRSVSPATLLQLRRGHAAGLGEGVGAVWRRDDNVVEDGKAEVSPYARKTFGYAMVLFAWRGIAGGMRVRQDNARGAKEKGVSKHQFGVDGRVALPPAGDDFITQEGECGGEAHNQEMFLVGLQNGEEAMEKSGGMIGRAHGLGRWWLRDIELHADGFNDVACGVVPWRECDVRSSGERELGHEILSGIITHVCLVSFFGANSAGLSGS